MAEGKKSFLLYTDIQHVVAKLTDVEAGQLFKHLLAYVNDQNPTAPTYLIEIVFEPIKQSLKRDLIKFENTKDYKSISGRIGNLKRWHLDLYNKFISKELTIEECEIIANNRKASQTDKVQSQPIANVANIAVNDSVNVNDSVIIDKSIIEKKIYLESKKNWEEIVTPSKWLDALIKNNFTTKEFLIARLKEFWVIANYLENPDRKQSKDIKLHFANWLKTNPPKKINKDYNPLMEGKSGEDYHLCLTPIDEDRVQEMKNKGWVKTPQGMVLRIKKSI